MRDDHFAGEQKLNAYRELCCQLVEDHYGDFYGTIYQILVGNRLAAPQVAQKCHLPLRQAKAGLSGLIQLRLLHHHTFKDGPTLYSASLTNAYNILRTGQLINFSQDAHGNIAGEILATACELGFATISELRDKVVTENGSPSDDVEAMIDELVGDHFLVHVRAAHFSETHDVRRAVEMATLTPSEIGKLTGTKAKLDFAETVDRGVNELVDPVKGDQGYVQDHKYSNGITNGTIHRQRRAELVQPNHQKVIAITQATVASQLAYEKHGKVASDIVYSMVLQIADLNAWSKLSPTYEHDIDVRSLREDVNTRYERQEEIRHSQTNGTNGINGHTTRELSNGDINLQLLYLTEGTLPFLDGSSDAWRLYRGEFENWLRNSETLKIMDSRLLAPAPRILRILIDKGKLEERTLQEIGLLGAKELRQNLSILKQMGYLELQEVPRNAQRMPNQTVFLWSYEGGKVHSVTVESLYAGMSKLMELLKIERSKIAATLSKVEREDVKGKEGEMLAEAEFLILKRFRKLEEWIWGEIHRMDMTMVVLRDT